MGIKAIKSQKRKHMLKNNIIERSTAVQLLGNTKRIRC